MTDASPPFVPANFVVPRRHDAEGFHLEPLGPEHNAADLDAWSSSIEHIRSTPGWAGHGWPTRPFTPEENLGDLERHARDFAERIGFTYTVMDEAGAVIGCVYLYPPRSAGHDVSVRSWVRVSHAGQDAALSRVVRDWLERDWPFASVDYAVRPGADPPAGR